MNAQDTFAVWVAERLLVAKGDPIAAAALAALAEGATTDEALDVALRSASVNTRRAGDLGLEFVEPLLPLLLVQFGRMLWDAYLKSLADRGGKELAAVTVDSVKALLKQTLTRRDGLLSVADADSELRKAAQSAGLKDEQVEKLLEGFHSSDAVRALTEK